MGPRNKLLSTFRSIHIEAGSRGWHLAGLLQELLPEEARVSSVVKSGAKFLNVVSNTPQMPDSYTVIVARQHLPPY